MEKLVKVAIDAMGGDNAPGEIVKGAIDAVNERNNLKVFLVGKSQKILFYKKERNLFFIIQSSKKSTFPLTSHCLRSNIVSDIR